MDRTQETIFKNICRKLDFPYESKFIQFRNLKEFRYFMIERINPNHKIELYGKLKKSKHNSKNLIHVGRIFLPTIALLNIGYGFLLIDVVNILTLSFSLMLCASLIYYCFDKVNIWRLLYDYSYRRWSRGWKDTSYVQVS